MDELPSATDAAGADAGSACAAIAARYPICGAPWLVMPDRSEPAWSPLGNTPVDGLGVTVASGSVTGNDTEDGKLARAISVDAETDFVLVRLFLAGASLFPVLADAMSVVPPEMAEAVDGFDRIDVRGAPVTAGSAGDAPSAAR